jgi:hypothetical protein
VRRVVAGAAVNPEYFARGLSARTDMLRVRRDDGYKLVGWPETLPAAPYAVLLADGAAYHSLGFDFDAHGEHSPAQVAADADALESLLRNAGVAHFSTVSSSSGGIHVWVPLAQPLKAPVVRRLAEAVATRFASFDPAPLCNPRAGAMRPPLAPHLDGSRSELRGSKARALTAVEHRADSWSVARFLSLLGVRAVNRHLSSALYSALRTGRVPKRYRTRSELVMALALSALSRSGEDGLAWLAEQLVDQRNHLAASLANEPKADGTVRNVRALIHTTFAEARRYHLVNPPFTPETAQEELVEVVHAAERARWTGQAGLSDLAALRALIGRAQRAGGPVFNCSERDLAEGMSARRATARRATARLSAAGWLRVVHGPTATLATTWRLRVPDGLRDGAGLADTAVSMDPITHPLFCHKSVGRAAGRIVAVLTDGPATAAEVAERTGLHPQTVRRSLGRLAHLEHSPVEKHARVWSLRTDPSPVDASTGDDDHQHPVRLTLSTKVWLDRAADETGAWAWMARLSLLHTNELAQYHRWRLARLSLARARAS